jgi:putative addiction module component (TIGR02574 family)
MASSDETDQDGVDESWAQEIDRRCAALDKGEAATSDWNEFRARIEREVFGR